MLNLVKLLQVKVKAENVFNKFKEEGIEAFFNEEVRKDIQDVEYDIVDNIFDAIENSSLDVNSLIEKYVTEDMIEKGHKQLMKLLSYKPKWGVDVNGKLKMDVEFEDETVV